MPTLKPILILALILPVTLIAVAAGESESIKTSDRDGVAETRVFVVEHIDTKSAITLLRSTLGTRRIAEIPKNRRLVVTDDPAKIAAVANLLAQTDVAPPRWQAELILVTPEGEQTVRRFDVEREEMALQFTGDLSVSLETDAPTLDELSGSYRIAVTFRGDESLNYQEAGKLTVQDGGRLDLFAPTMAEQRERLARMVGMTGEGRELFLRFRRSR